MTTAHPAQMDSAAMFKNVIVGIRDDETGPDAIALAGQLTSPSGALTLVHVREVADKPAADSGAARAARLRHMYIERLQTLAQSCSVDASVACVDAHSPRRGLHEFAAGSQADLLVVRATARDELERDLIRDDTRRVLEAAPCAVAVAPPGYRACGATVGRIGVAYNGSAESRQALAFGRTLAAERDAELSAFEVVDTPLYAHDSWEMREQIDRSVTRARKRIAALGGLEAEAGFGHHVDELAHYAESVDLLILGAHRYTLADRLLERSTAQLLADSTASPLLVLAAPSHAAAVQPSSDVRA
jgi:nucleotide-binding universal stress UspA family protein